MQGKCNARCDSLLTTQVRGEVLRVWGSWHMKRLNIKNKLGTAAVSYTFARHLCTATQTLPHRYATKDPNTETGVGHPGCIPGTIMSSITLLHRHSIKHGKLQQQGDLFSACRMMNMLVTSISGWMANERESYGGKGQADHPRYMRAWCK